MENGAGVMHYAKLIGLAAAFAGTLTMAGCQSAGVDALETTSIGQQTHDVSQSDLDQGKKQFRQGNYGLAEKHFREAVELRADNAEAWMGLAASYDELGRFDFADRAYEQLLKVAGRQPRVVNNMGYSQLLRGNEGKARTLLMEARGGMSDTSVVDRNLTLLNRG